MSRYRVKVRNAQDCRTSIKFLDLCIHYSNGYSPCLEIVEGNEIPLELCDQEDVKKSWIVGTLNSYLNNGWIEEIPKDLTIKEVTPISQFITEQMVLAPKVGQIQIVDHPKQEVPSPQPNLPEAVKVEDKIVVVNEQITDLSLVKSFEDFNKLSHFLKLRWIKETNNIELLRQIQTLTTSAQQKNNINLRLSGLK